MTDKNLLLFISMVSSIISVVHGSTEMWSACQHNDRKSITGLLEAGTSLLFTDAQGVMPYQLLPRGSSLRNFVVRETLGQILACSGAGDSWIDLVKHLVRYEGVHGNSNILHSVQFSEATNDGKDCILDIQLYERILARLPEEIKTAGRLAMSDEDEGRIRYINFRKLDNGRTALSIAVSNDPEHTKPVSTEIVKIFTDHEWISALIPDHTGRLPAMEMLQSDWVGPREARDLIICKTKQQASLVGWEAVIRYIESKTSIPGNCDTIVGATPDNLQGELESNTIQFRRIVHDWIARQLVL